MTARADVSESLGRLTGKVKVMAVSAEPLFRRRATDIQHSDSVAECCFVNENGAADLAAELHHMVSIRLQLSEHCTQSINT